MYAASRSGAADNSSEIQQLRHEREHLIVLCRNLETEKLACQSAVRSLEAQVAENSTVGRND